MEQRPYQLDLLLTCSGFEYITRVGVYLISTYFPPPTERVEGRIVQRMPELRGFEVLTIERIHTWDKVESDESI